MRTYTGEKIEVIGKADIIVSYQDQSVELSITVVKGTGPSLMGCDWLQHLQLDWKLIFKIDGLKAGQTDELQTLLRKYPNVFKEGLGTLQSNTAKIYVDYNAKPKFFKA